MCTTEMAQPGNFLTFNLEILIFSFFCKIKTKLAQLGVAQLRRLDCKT